MKVEYPPSDVDKDLRSGNDFIEEDASRFNFISVAYFDLPFYIGHVNEKKYGYFNMSSTFSFWSSALLTSYRVLSPLFGVFPVLF